MRERATGAVAAIMVVTALVSCSASEKQPTDDGKSAAEPADAPPLTQEPAGTVFDLPVKPQGIVYDASTRSLAVAARDPDRLLVVDPTDLTVRRTVRLGGKVRHLQVDPESDSVLVPSETANTLYVVPLTGDDEIAEIPVPKHPHDATGSDGWLVTANEFARSISIIRDGAVVKTISDLRQPGGVVADGAGRVAVVDVGDYTVSSYDLATQRRIDRLPAGNGPTHAAMIAPNRLVVADTRGDHLLLYSVSPLRQIASLDLAGSPYGLASDPTESTVWVSLTGRNEVVGLELDSDRLREIDRLPTVRQPDTVAVAPGGRMLWVTGTTDGVVQRITR